MIYRFAVVGCGLMGVRHAAVLKATEGYELAAVCDNNEAQAKSLASKYGLPVRTLDEILGDESIHGVVLTLPSQLHGEVGLRAIAAGKHIIMEKPLTTRPDEGRKLLSAARHAGKILAVIAQNRFSDGALSLKASLEAGLLGKIIIARASVKWFRDDKYYLGSDWRGRRDGEGGGVLMNQAIHSTDMLIHLLGRPQAVVAMCARNRDIIDTEDAATVVLSFPRKVVASMEASTSTWPGFEESYEIHGNAGYATLARGVLTQFATRSGEPAVPPPAQKPPTVDDGKLVLFQRQYWNIYEAMENGPDRLLVTPEESLWVVETTHQMYETASQLSSETLSL